MPDADGMALPEDVTPDEDLQAPDATWGGRRVRCDLCGFAYREELLTYRNGLLVCTVPGRFKALPCFDDVGREEEVHTSPLDLGPLPDEEV